jgi:hypothetical protein
MSPDPARVVLAEKVEDGIRYQLVVNQLDPTAFDGRVAHVTQEPKVVATRADA